MHGLSDAGLGFLFPKKFDGLALPGLARAVSIGLGLEGATDEAAGVKVGALAFGRNSDAFTLNFVDTAEVGVWADDRCGLERPD